MMDKLKDKFYNLFRCLVNVGKPKKKDGNRCSMERVELLWKEREYYTNVDLNDRLFILSDLLGIESIKEETIEAIADSSDDII